MRKQTLQQDILMRSIKILDIGYIGCIYVVFAFLLAYLTDKVLGKFDEEAAKKKSNARLTLEMLIGIWAYGVLAYVVRNVAELIPFPLHGFHGFDHFRVKELKSASIFLFCYLIISNYLRSYVAFYYKHVLQRNK